MPILVVDDSPPVLRLLQSMLERAGFSNIKCLDSGLAALELLGITAEPDKKIVFDCILLDIVMPGINGIETCRMIKEQERFHDTPVIMVTIKDEQETLKEAFDAGASDYITKPVGELELTARVTSAVRLKKETDKRKAREAELVKLGKELEEKNTLLEELTITDEITKVGNRRYFNACLENEWRRSFRDAAPLSLVLVDIDNFREYADLHGQVSADNCLKLIAQVLQVALRRVGDHLSRYSGSKFAVFLPQTDINGAKVVAKCMQESVTALQLKHSENDATPTYVSISLGAACVVPSGEMAISNLLVMAEDALGMARTDGGNTIICYGQS